MAKQPLISVCMIVKDESLRIQKAIESVKGFADEILVFDTGSTDNTVKLARSAGAKVLQDKPVMFMTKEEDGFDRIHFSACRNHVARKAKGQWIFVLDGDEEVGVVPDNFRALLKDAAAAGMTHAYCSNAAFGKEGYGGSSWTIRVYKADSKVHWERPVHNVLVGLDPSKAFMLQDAVVQSYYVQREREGGKDERSKPMLEKVWRQSEGKALWAANYLSTLCASRGEDREAMQWAVKVLEQAPADPLYARAWHALVQSALRVDGLDKAEMLLHEGLRHHPKYADLHLLRTVYALARLDTVLGEAEEGDPNAVQYNAFPQAAHTMDLAEVAKALRIRWPYVQKIDVKRIGAAADKAPPYAAEAQA